MLALWSVKSNLLHLETNSSILAFIESPFPRASHHISGSKGSLANAASSNSRPSLRKSIPFSCSMLSESLPRIEKTSSKRAHKPSPSPSITLISARQRQFRSSVKSWSIACLAFCSAHDIFSSNRLRSLLASPTNF